MKDIITKINENVKDRLKDLVIDFCEILDETDDDSREQFVMELIKRTIETDEEQHYTNGRCKECWKYAIENCKL